MPTYEYRCSCAEHRQFTERRADGDLCGICGDELKRVWHAPHVSYRGDGFTKGVSGVDYDRAG